MVCPINYSFAETQFSCREWISLSQEMKNALVERFIQIENDEGGVILKLPASYYAKEINNLVQTYITTKNEEGLNTSIGVTLHTIAAMEGDWDNGENKLEHAKKWMGEEYFEFFKENYPEKYKRLIENK